MLPAAASAADAAVEADAADATDFDPTFLPGGVGSADLARFSRGNQVLPGRYQVDVYLNEMFHGSEQVRFDVPPGRSDAAPCVTEELSQRLWLDLSGAAPISGCRDLQAWDAAATARFDVGEQRLYLGVPQARLCRSARGYVDPSRWDRGVTAGLLNYDFNTYRSTGQGQRETQAYLGLSGGINLGGWNLRHQSSLSWNSSSRKLDWQSVRAYGQRDIPRWKAQLFVGDFSTNGELFDSVALRGAQVYSDERMLPDSQRGYAPVVRGIAATHAKVTVRQNGYVLYETTVGTGPFRIDDLYPTGYGGDLEVSVLEADGREQKYTVPYAAVPRMLRPGASRFSLAAGQFRDGGGAGDVKAPVVQATWQRGVSNGSTMYGGVQLAQRYGAVLAGAAFNTPVGAFGLDVTHARTRLPGADGMLRAAVPLPVRTLSGQSVRVSYGKAINDSGTHISVAAYRYSTRDFYSLRDALTSTRHEGAAFRRRSSAQVTLSQSIGKGGSLYLAGSAQNYWGRTGSDAQYQLGYSNATRWFTYSVSASRSRGGDGRMDNRLFATLSIPLGRGNLNAGIDFGHGGVGEQVNYGSALGERASYGVSLNRAASGSSSVNASGTYRARDAVLNGSVAAGDGYRQYSFGATGALLAHAGGVTFGQNMGDTVALVKAPDAAGARVSSYPGARLDRHGYAIVPYLVPYQRNQVELDPADLSSDVELLEASHEVVPRNGAVVMASFATKKGRVAVIDIAPAQGVVIPFGTDVLDEQGQVVGVMSQGGRALVRGISDRGRLTLALAEGRRCRFSYALPTRDLAASGVNDYAHLSAICDAGAPK